MSISSASKFLNQSREFLNRFMNHLRNDVLTESMAQLMMTLDFKFIKMQVQINCLFLDVKDVINDSKTVGPTALVLTCLTQFSEKENESFNKAFTTAQI